MKYQACIELIKLELDEPKIDRQKFNFLQVMDLYNFTPGGISLQTNNHQEYGDQIKRRCQKSASHCPMGRRVR